MTLDWMRLRDEPALTSRPCPRFARRAVPLGVRPTRLPWMTLSLAPVLAVQSVGLHRSTPRPALPEITFRSAGAEPPILFREALLVTTTPKALELNVVAPKVPAALVPRKFPASVLSVPPEPSMRMV